MYLPPEINPQDDTLYLVVEPQRHTGSNEITYITTVRDHAVSLAATANGYLLQVSIVADYR